MAVTRNGSKPPYSCILCECPMPHSLTYFYIVHVTAFLCYLYHNICLLRYAISWLDFLFFVMEQLLSVISPSPIFPQHKKWKQMLHSHLREGSGHTGVCWCCYASRRQLGKMLASPGTDLKSRTYCYLFSRSLGKFALNLEGFQCWSLIIILSERKALLR